MRIRRAPAPPAVSGPGADVAVSLAADAPIIEATLNGQGPFRFLFDTGAPGGVRLSPEAVQRLGLTQIGEARTSDPSGQNPRSRPVYRLDALQVGEVTVSGWDTVAAPPLPSKAGAVDGVIGLSGFHGYVVTLNYATGRFTLTPGALPAPDGQSVFAYDEPIPRIPLEIEGKALEAHLDTGNSRYGVIVSDQAAATLAGYAAAKPIGKARTDSQVIEMFAAETRQPIKVGALALPVTSIGWPAIIPLANVGSPALKGLVVSVDPKNRRVRITRPT